MKNRRFVAGLLAVFALAGCRGPSPLGMRAPARKDHVELPGCYALHAGSGLPMDSFYRASPRIRLDTAQYQEPWMPVAWRLMIRLDAQNRPIVDSPPRPEPPLWRFDPKGDSLKLSFADGFSGASLSLHAPPGTRDTLRGTIQENWDFGPPYSTSRTSAYAVRIPCPQAAP